MRTLFDILLGNVPWLIAAILLSILAIFFVLYMVLKKAGSATKKVKSMAPVAPKRAPESAEKSKSDSGGSEKSPSRITESNLRPAFDRGMNQLKTSAPSRNYRYHVPWLLFLAEDGSEDALLPSSLPHSIAVDEAATADDQPLRWWFFDEAVILTIGRNFLMRADSDVREEKQWLSLLKLIQRNRPERPLDGLVISIPARELLRTVGADHESYDTMLQRADRLRAVLQAIPAQIGMRLPIYVLVSDCQSIEGFGSFGRSIPRRLQQQIFGWSSPYPVDSNYSATWIDEMFRELNRDLLHIQSQSFAEQGEGPENDGHFIFPERFQRLREPLREYLNRLFKRSAYYESFFFRGVYLCGQSSLDPALPTASDDTSQSSGEQEESLRLPGGDRVSRVDDRGRRVTLFLEELFLRKIFPEAGLAQPIARHLGPRNRRVRIVQAACIVMAVMVGLTVLWTHPRLKADRGNLQNLLVDIRGDLEEITQTPEDLSANSYGSGLLDFRGDAQKILQGMEAIQERRYGSWLMPSSWFDPLGDNIVRAMQLAYEQVILRSLHIALQIKANTVIDSGFGEGLIEYIRNLETLEDRVKDYDTLRRQGQGDLATLRRVVGYLELADLAGLSQDLDSNSIFQEALRLSQVDLPFPLEDFRETVSFNLLTKIEQLYQTELDLNPLVLDVTMLDKKLSEIETAERTNYEDMEQLKQAVTRARASIGQPENAWLSEAAFDPDKRFPTVRKYIGQSLFLRAAGDESAEFRARTAEEIARQFIDSGVNRFDDVQESLRTADSQLTGPLLTEPAGNDRWKLSAGVAELENWVDSMLKLVYRWPTSEPEFSFTFPIRWEPAYLQEAVQFYRQYEGITDAVPRAPAGDTRPAIERLEGRLVTLLTRADDSGGRSNRSGSHQTAADFVREIQNFVAAAESLREVLEILDSPRMENTYRGFSSLITMQATHVLRHLDDMLQEEGLYEVRDGNFNWWSGEPNVGLLAFNVLTPNDRQIYLKSQRRRLEFLAHEYAQPTMTLLSNTATVTDLNNNPSVEMWRSIITEIESYEKKDANSTLVALESYLTQDIDAVTPFNCGQHHSESSWRDDTNDFFLEKRNSLQVGLYERCQSLTTTTSIGRYENLARVFNERLAGRFPFGDKPQPREPEPGTLPDAAPDDIRQFFLLLAAEGPTTLAYLQNNTELGAGREPGIEFLTRMRALQGLFAEFLADNQPGAVPALDFEIEFRVNEDISAVSRQQCGSNQIIQWVLTVAGQQFEYPSPAAEATEDEKIKLTGRWHYDDPIELTFRWARNSPCSPIFDIDKLGYRVEDKTAVLQYRNPWSILAAMRQNASVPQDFPRFLEHPDVLKFTLPVLPNWQRSGTREEAERDWFTKVFLRFMIKPPGKDNVLLVPQFPRQAPRLRAQVSVSASEGL